MGLPSVRAELLLKTLRRLEVNLLSSACAIEIGDGSVSYTNFRGQQRKLRADHVVIAKGATEDVATAQQFEAANLNVFTVGDCKSIDYIDGAFMDAALLAQTL